MFWYGLLSLLSAICSHISFLFQTLGNLRPPLFTMGDNFRGFPAFLSNQFAGNSKEELFCGLLHTKLFTREEIEKAVELAEMFKADNSV